ncbi:DNA-dependent metalloprotease WSS1-like isoform X2 [Lycium barbarum]|uniref:DNA-dependent metalloprotease WSS1-like isoform X2 n=1 Tax=Lycium barbarum TaxID=112863 RepID=UPI00293F5E7D|nr:DNA-dependent metalloprotease WSS1-like isoform X2 [Lycium barbarum]
MNNLGDLNKVWEIRALKRKPKHEEANKILERIAKQVQPIMRKHNWRVKLLSEMCPKRAALLGLNVGAGIHVKLRLRRPNNNEEFYPYNEVLDTMLHELCHNAHGPHNASFYKLWDELRKECEDLINKGISGTGEGFDLHGKRLGGLHPQPSLSSLRQTAAAAAENRARLKSLLPSGPRRLGGDHSIKSALTPIQAAAMAAERRLQDNIWCGSEFCDLSDVDETSDSLPEPLPLGSKLSNGVDAVSSKVTSRKRSRESNSVSSSRSLHGHTVTKSVPKPLSNHDKEIARGVGQAEANSHTVPSRGCPESFIDLTGH